MKRAFLFGLTILLVGLVAIAVPMAGAQTDQTGSSSPSTDMSNMTGTVVSSSSTALVVRTDSGSQMTFVVDSSSTLPSNLSAGDRVTVDYSTMSDGQYHASTVSAMTGAGSAGSASGASSMSSTSSTSGTSGTSAGATGSLPRTASRVPLVALIGAVALGAAIGMRFLSRARNQA